MSAFTDILHSRLHIRRRSLLSRLLDLWSLSRQRHALSGLDDHLLRDIGLTRNAAQSEAERPIWDAPATWRR